MCESKRTNVFVSFLLTYIFYIKKNKLGVGVGVGVVCASLWICHS